MSETDLGFLIMKNNIVKCLIAVLFLLSLFACNSAKNTDSKEGSDSKQGVSADSIVQNDNKVISLDSAIIRNDWEGVRSLAKKGDVAACGALAKHYATSAATVDNHSKAYYWAQKSAETDKKHVMDILEKYGFVVDGKPTVEIKEDIE